MTAMRLKRYPSPSGGIALGKMGVGATMLNEWKNPYITDGLIALWDGEWNAGGGVHDAAATAWTDCINGYKAILEKGSPTWGAKGCTLSNSPFLFNDLGSSRIRDAFVGGNITVEVVGKFATNGGGALIAFGDVVRGGLIDYRYNSATVLCYSKLEYVNNTLGWGIANVSYPTSISASRGILINSTITIQGHTQYKYYLNSVNKRSQTNTRGAGYNCIVLGDDQNGTHFSGEIDCVRVYSGILTAAEIAANYAIDKERFNLP